MKKSMVLLCIEKRLSSWKVDDVLENPLSKGLICGRKKLSPPGVVTCSDFSIVTMVFDTKMSMTCLRKAPTIGDHKQLKTAVSENETKVRDEMKELEFTTKQQLRTKRQSYYCA